MALLNMKDLEERLPNSFFIRIHKSYIISFPKIRMIDGHRVFLYGRTEALPVGESYQRGCVWSFQPLCGIDQAVLYLLVAEGFFKTLKAEMVYHRKFIDQQSAKRRYLDTSKDFITQKEHILLWGTKPLSRWKRCRWKRKIGSVKNYPIFKLQFHADFDADNGKLKLRSEAKQLYDKLWPPELDAGEKRKHRYKYKNLGSFVVEQ